MTVKTHALVLSATMALAACTHPADVSRPLAEVEDKNAKFEVKDAPGGLTVEVRYSRYQFVPDSGTVRRYVKEAEAAGLISLAPTHGGRGPRRGERIRLA